MNDYELERLNSRSFEQLVQALAISVFGHQVSVFGDGPDGGREAAFSGAVPYPEAGRRWNGYGVVQAKFKQHLESVAKANADWALSELRSEFKKLRPKPKRAVPPSVLAQERFCPDYYIFATNVRLSPMLQSGGKDRVFSFLEEKKLSHGLKGYAVWDGDQLRRMLDGNGDIRTSFLPFILSGDVLARVIDSLQANSPDFAAVMLRHLQHELLDDQYAKLSQGGYTNANQVSLSNVFVDLPVDLGQSAEAKLLPGAARQSTILGNIFEEAAYVLKPSLRSPQQQGMSAGAKNAGSAAGRFVVIGGPGQGKTTAGVFACQVMRANLLRATGQRFDPAVENAVADVLKQAESLPSLAGPRYPIRVDLKRLAESLAAKDGTGADSLLDFLTKSIAKRTSSKLDTSDFRKWLKSYPWLLVLDGLDEVPASSNRSLMIDAINDFVRVEAHQEDADLLVVATTRPQGYSDEFDAANYVHLTLRPLQPKEALHYGRRLAEARHSGATARIDELLKTLSLAIKNGATARLMESPLQVTIMLSLVELGGHPPEQRWQLFHQYYDTIFKREKERGTSFSSILRDYEADIHWIHHRAGWVLQQRNAEAGKTAARLSHSEFDELVRQRLLDRGHNDDHNLRSLVTQMRNAATDRLVLLVGNTAHEIGFEIRSLQEFMAAEHMFDGSDESLRSAFKLIAPHSYWRNVFLFIAGRIFFSKESMVDSLIAVCEELNEPLNDAAYAQIGAGSKLALAMLADDACRKQPKNTRRLARLVSRLLDKPLWDERQTVGKMLTRDAGEILKAEVAERFQVSTLPFGLWSAVLVLVKQGNDWAKNVFLKNFPWRDPDCSRFLYYHFDDEMAPDDFFMRRLAINLRHVSLVCVNKITRRASRNVLPKLIDEDVASAITHLLARQEIKLEATDGSILHNSLTGVLDASPYLKLKMYGEDFSDAHMEWRILSHCERFARNPSFDSLLEELDHIYYLIKTPAPSYIFPWQINVCLEALQSGRSVEEIGAMVRSGKLGNPSDWSKWSEIRSLPLRSLGQKKPFEVSDAAFGPAFCAAGWRHSRQGASSELAFLGHLTAALESLDPSSSIAQTLLQVSAYGLTRVAPDLGDNEYPYLKEFFDSARRLKHDVAREFIAVVLLSKLSVEKKLELISDVQWAVRSRYWVPEVPGGRSALETAWAEVHDYAEDVGNISGVTCALALVPPLACMAKVSESEKARLNKGGDMQRKAVRLLSVGVMNFPKDHTNSLVDTLIELAEDEPFWIAEWIESVDASGIYGEACENFLLQLLKQASGDVAERFSLSFNRLLLKVVDRRPAPVALPDPAA